MDLPGSEQSRCWFSPGWSIRAYEDSIELALFEAAFCFSCHEVRMHGTAVPPATAMPCLGLCIGDAVTGRVVNSPRKGSSLPRT
ncbi:hypothetical protein [Streptomyces sp. NPDC055749]